MPGACKTSLSIFDGVVSDCVSQPFETTDSSVLRHHTIMEAYDVGFECFCSEKSEYSVLRRDWDIETYVGRLESCDEGIMKVVAGRQGGEEAQWPRRAHSRLCITPDLIA